MLGVWGFVDVGGDSKARTAVGVSRPASCRHRVP